MPPERRVRRAVQALAPPSRVTGLRPTAALQAAFAFVAILLVLSSIPLLWGRLAPVPSRSEAQELVDFFDGRLLAYEVWDGDPYVVFASHGRIRLDRLWKDPISHEFPPIPRWQLSGRWSQIGRTDGPASVGVVSCEPPALGRSCTRATRLFGEIGAPEIVRMEVRYDGAWHGYEVAAPGYAMRLDGFHGEPGGYRWLNAAGEVVWSMLAAD